MPENHSPSDLLADHLRGGPAAVCQEADGRLGIRLPLPAVVFPGSFNPLHAGHTTLAAVAARLLGGAVAFELSTANVDKPDLPEAEVRRRLLQFHGRAAVWVTRAPTFEAKAELFPASTFVVGYDTAVRLVDPRYYEASESRRDAALGRLLDRGCRFLVGGRVVGGEFRVWDATAVRPAFRELFRILTEDDFRVDCSSSDLRTAVAAQLHGQGEPQREQ